MPQRLPTHPHGPSAPITPARHSAALTPPAGDLKDRSTCYRCEDGLGGAYDAPNMISAKQTCVGGNVSAFSSTGTTLGWAADLGMRLSGASQSVVTGGDCLAIIGVEGIMSNEEFNTRSSSKCLGRAPLRADPGRNCPQCILVYWSAPALTHVARADVLLRAALLGGESAL